MKGDVKNIFCRPRDGEYFLVRDSQPTLTIGTPLILQHHSIKFARPMKGDVKNIFCRPRDGEYFLVRDSQPTLTIGTPLILQHHSIKFARCNRIRRELRNQQ
jgi:hypothetical protein